MNPLILLGGAVIVYYLVKKNSGGYTKYSNKDSPGNDIRNANTLDVNQLMNNCNMDTTCAGFNSGGWIKKDINTTLSDSPGHDLYVKKKYGY